TGARVHTSAKSDVTVGVWARGIEGVGFVEMLRVAVRGPVEHHQNGAGRNVDAANGARYPRQPEVTLDWTLGSQDFLDEVGDALTAELLLDVGALREDLQGGAQQAHGCLLAGGEYVGGHAHDVDDLRRRAVRKRRGGKTGEHVVARLAAAALAVAVETFVYRF